MLEEQNNSSEEEVRDYVDPVGYIDVDISACEFELKKCSFCTDFEKAKFMDIEDRKITQ